MQIEIVEIFTNNMVKFKTKYGTAVGMWKDGIAPKLENYCVEFDWCEKLKFSDIIVERSENYLIEGGKNNNITIKGLLCSYDDDGYASLSVDDSIVGFETEYNQEFIEMVGKYIMFNIKEIFIYDEHF